MLKNPLTPREKHLVKALVNGETRQDYAVETGLSISTVSNLQRQILARLNARTMLQAVSLLIKDGMGFASRNF